MEAWDGIGDARWNVGTNQIFPSAKPTIRPGRQLQLPRTHRPLQIQSVVDTRRPGEVQLPVAVVMLLEPGEDMGDEFRARHHFQFVALSFPMATLSDRRDHLVDIGQAVELAVPELERHRNVEPGAQPAREERGFGREEGATRSATLSG